MVTTATSQKSPRKIGESEPKTAHGSDKQRRQIDEDNARWHAISADLAADARRMERLLERARWGQR